MVSIDGSHLNQLYCAMPPNSVLVILMPSNRFTMAQIGYARGAGLRYGFVIIEPAGNGDQVDIADLFRTLDLAAAR